MLKGATAELQFKLKQSDLDTRQTKGELEMIEKMVKSVNDLNQGKSSENSWSKLVFSSRPSA